MDEGHEKHRTDSQAGEVHSTGCRKCFIDETELRSQNSVGDIDNVDEHEGEKDEDESQDEIRGLAPGRPILCSIVRYILCASTVLKHSPKGH